MNCNGEWQPFYKVNGRYVVGTGGALFLVHTKRCPYHDSLLPQAPEVQE